MDALPDGREKDQLRRQFIMMSTMLSSSAMPLQVRPSAPPVSTIRDTGVSSEVAVIAPPASASGETVAPSVLAVTEKRSSDDKPDEPPPKKSKVAEVQLLQKQLEDRQRKLEEQQNALAVELEKKRVAMELLKKKEAEKSAKTETKKSALAGQMRMSRETPTDISTEPSVAQESATANVEEAQSIEVTKSSPAPQATLAVS
jgi:hypothetical protein